MLELSELISRHISDPPYNREQFNKAAWISGETWEGELFRIPISVFFCMNLWYGSLYLFLIYFNGQTDMIEIVLGSNPEARCFVFHIHLANCNVMQNTILNCKYYSNKKATIVKI